MNNIDVNKSEVIEIPLRNNSEISPKLFFQTNSDSISDNDSNSNPDLDLISDPILIPEDSIMSSLSEKKNSKMNVSAILQRTCTQSTNQIPTIQSAKSDNQHKKYSQRRYFDKPYNDTNYYNQNYHNQNYYNQNNYNWNQNYYNQNKNYSNSYPSGDNTSYSIDNFPSFGNKNKLSSSGGVERSSSSSSLTLPQVYSKKEIDNRFTNNQPFPINNTKSNNKYKKKPYQSKSFSPPHMNYVDTYKPYDAVLRAKGAGIIPYTVIDGKIYFLFQKADNPNKKKDFGWNDFGGKKNLTEENTSITAAREFSEETSCLFYLKEQTDEQSKILYEELKDNQTLTYSTDVVNKLKQIITLSAKFFSNKINTYINPLYISSKETYISYIIKVKYVPIIDIPRAEDIHIPYEERYIRKCKWFSMEEFMLLTEYDFHKRLQITKIKNRIQNFYERGCLE
jgi:hypothetical protein